MVQDGASTSDVGYLEFGEADHMGGCGHFLALARACQARADLKLRCHTIMLEIGMMGL